MAIADDQLPRPSVYCLVLSVSQETLQSRLLRRELHPTIHGGEEGMRVLSQMSRQYQPPTIYGGEGLDRIYVLDEMDQPSAAEGWRDQRVLEIVDRVGNDGRREVGERKTTALRLELMTTTRARENPVVTLEGEKRNVGREPNKRIMGR